MESYNLKKKKQNVYEETIIRQDLRKDEFSEYIGKIQKEKHVTTQELAIRMGIGYQSFRKILNKTQATKSRDCIIAICSQLQMNTDQTNKALMKYNYMPSLDSDTNEYYSMRDDYIISLLEESSTKLLSISEINQRLIIGGYLPLELHLRNRKKEIINLDNNFEIIETKIRILEENYTSDRYSSLETEYHPNKYECIGNMYLINKTNNEKLFISYSSKEKYLMQRIDCDMFPNDIEFKNIDQVLKPYFLSLKNIVIKKMRNYYSCSNDTKNYISRKSAKFIDDGIICFSEKFYYNVPERNHYYFFKYKNGKYTFSISNESMFMKYYLTNDEYSNYFGKPNSKHVIVEFNSLNDIDNYFKINDSNIGNSNHLKNEFTKMKCEVDELFQQIKNKEIYIRNLNEIYDYYEKNLVCRFFGLEKEFNLHEVNEGYDCYLEANESAMVLDSQTNELAYLTLEDLYEAFELGLNTKDDILRIKNKYGSIVAILY